MHRPPIGNIGVAAFSVLAATVLWATFAASPVLVRSVSAPIEFRRMPANLEISSAVPGNIYLELRGPSARLHSRDLVRETVALDLGTVSGPGEHTFTIQSSNIDLQPGIELVRAVPSQVRLRFERRVTAQVPVHVRFASPPPPGYRIASQAVSPPQVAVVGPESHVRDVDAVQTDPIIIPHDIPSDVAKRDFRVNTQTFVRDPYVRLHSSPAVTVSITLAKEQ